QLRTHECDRATSRRQGSTRVGDRDRVCLVLCGADSGWAGEPVVARVRCPGCGLAHCRRGGWGDVIVAVGLSLKGTRVQIAELVARAGATVHHPPRAGMRLLRVQMLPPDGGPDGEPVLALDTLGAAAGSRVIVTTDSLGVRELVQSKNSPARYSV